MESTCAIPAQEMTETKPKNPHLAHCIVNFEIRGDLRPSTLRWSDFYCCLINTIMQLCNDLATFYTRGMRPQTLWNIICFPAFSSIFQCYDTIQVQSSHQYNNLLLPEATGLIYIDCIGLFHRHPLQCRIHTSWYSVCTEQLNPCFAKCPIQSRGMRRL